MSLSHLVSEWAGIMHSVSSLQCTLWCCFLQATFALASPCLCLWLEAEMITLTSKWRLWIVRVTHCKFSWSQQETLKLLIRAQTIITKTRMVKMNCEMALCWMKKNLNLCPSLKQTLKHIHGWQTSWNVSNYKYSILLLKCTFDDNRKLKAKKYFFQA